MSGWAKFGRFEFKCDGDRHRTFDALSELRLRDGYETTLTQGPILHKTRCSGDTSDARVGYVVRIRTGSKYGSRSEGTRRRCTR